MIRENERTQVTHVPRTICYEVRDKAELLQVGGGRVSNPSVIDWKTAGFILGPKRNRRWIRDSVLGGWTYFDDLEALKSVVLVL